MHSNEIGSKKNAGHKKAFRGTQGEFLLSEGDFYPLPTVVKKPIN